MADSALITRRAAITGALVSAAALAVPAVAAVKELSSSDKLQQFLDRASPEDLVQYHASKLAEALCAARPGLWRFSTRTIEGQGGGHVLFHRYDSSFVGYAQDYR